MDFNSFFIIEKISNDVKENHPKSVPILKNEKDPSHMSVNKEKIDSSESWPIQMMFWIDLNWEGVWVDEMDSGKTPECAVFHLRKRILPLKHSTLRQDDSGETINDSVKIQFFTNPNRPTNMPDFRFMSACPLCYFFEKNYFTLGLWNYNVEFCDRTGKAMPNFLLTVFNNDYHKNTIPPSIYLIKNEYVPSPKHHNRVIAITNKVKQIMDALFPSDTTEFKTIRTYGRNAWLTTFSFDLHKIFETDMEGTNLPPVLALYIVCNACIINQVQPDAFLNLLENVDDNPEEIETLLSMVRDIIMCFTMCQREGAYRDDLSLGVLVEDQPFSFAFRPGDNVFDEDDCEGHDQQGCVHIKGLFKLIFRDFVNFGLRNVNDHLQSVLGRADSCLNFNGNTLACETIVGICVKLGGMFEEENLNAIMCVGEANFSSFGQVVEKDSHVKPKEKLDGHSFGLLLYQRDGDIKGSMILETTGWSTKKSKVSKTSSQMIEKMKAIIMFSRRQLHKEDKIIVRTALNEITEDKLYVRVFSGDNCLFFTFQNKTLSYGASPSHINKHAMMYTGQSMDQIAALGTVVLMVSPEMFFKSLNDSSSPWGRHKGAEVLLKKYHKIKQMYPAFHKCLMPPQITEDQFMDRIKQNWGVINWTDLGSSISPPPPKADVLAFSCRSSSLNHHDVNQFIASLSSPPPMKMTQHNFMQSTLFVLQC